MTLVKVKSSVKKILPPIALRLIKTFRPERMPLKGQEQPPEFYEQQVIEEQRWHKHYTESGYYPLWTVIADRIMLAQVNSILEIACGTGQLALLLHDKGLPNYRGFDFNREAVKSAKEKHRELICPEFDFVVADAFKTDLFHSHNYDAVLCTEFLEHVEGDLEVIEKIRSGTHFYGTVPNYPAPAHVRVFNNTNEVAERYAKYFNSFRVDAHLCNLRGMTLYLLEGTKK